MGCWARLFYSTVRASKREETGGEGNHEEGLTEAKEMQRVAVEEVREFIPLWGI